jgi:hypothetical protein
MIRATMRQESMPLPATPQDLRLLKQHAFEDHDTRLTSLEQT